MSTLGPWQVYELSNVVRDRDGNNVATVHGGPEAQAAILAVPDLIRALELLLSKATARGTAPRHSNDFSAWHGCSAVDIGEILNEARYALRKAKP